MNNLSQLQKELLSKFRDEIYENDDALFDRRGNNMSRWVETLFSITITRTWQEAIDTAIATLEKTIQEERYSGAPYALNEVIKSLNLLKK